MCTLHIEKPAETQTSKRLASSLVRAKIPDQDFESSVLIDTAVLTEGKDLWSQSFLQYSGDPDVIRRTRVRIPCVDRLGELTERPLGSEISITL